MLFKEVILQQTTTRPEKTSPLAFRGKFKTRESYEGSLAYRVAFRKTAGDAAEMTRQSRLSSIC